MAEDMANKTAAKQAAKASAELKKQKKKKWVPIVAPEIFGNRVIGESLLDDASMIMNRTVTVNMMQLSGDMKRQNINIMFKVNDVKEGKGFTEAVKFELSPSSTRRLAKREKDKVTDSFVVKTSDGKLVRIKPIMITSNMTKGSIRTALIKACRAYCKELVNKTVFNQLISDLVNYKFQKEIRDGLHKTYPLRFFEIRMLLLETKKKKETVEEEMLLKLKKQKETEEAERKEAEEAERHQSPQSQVENIEEQEELYDDTGDTPEDESLADDDSAA
jgi:ribosomal protein S3AE